MPPISTKNYPQIFQGINPPFVPDTSFVDPRFWARSISFPDIVFGAPGSAFVRQAITISRPSLVKITGLSGPAGGPGLIAAVDNPLVTVTARAGQGGANTLPTDQFFLDSNDLCVRGNRGYLWLPYPGQWIIEANVSGCVVAPATWRLQGYIYEGYSEAQYGALVNAPPSVVVTAQIVMGANICQLIQLGGGAGFNDISFRSIRVQGSAAGGTYCWGSNVGHTISTNASTDLLSDNIPLGLLRINAPAAGFTLTFCAALDP